MKREFVVGLVIGLGFAFSSCTKHTIDDPDPKDPVFVGSATCKSCHLEIYNRTQGTAMYNALTVVDNEAPVIGEISYDLLTPDDYSWEGLSFVIGGFAWSVAFVTDAGYVVTQKPGSQFNILDESRIPYKPEVENGTQEFVCGECHTTGWGQVTDQSSPHALGSFPESYFEEGVRCEVCHGPGSVHSASSAESDITLDNSSELCAQCHQRNEDNSIISEGSFIAIGQQYEEWYSSKHRDEEVGCNSCHDPHASVMSENASGEGVVSCESCHTEQNADKHFAMSISCTVCHMPKSLKIAIQKNEYTGDASAHIFKINPDAEYSMFSEDGLVNKDGSGMSLDYVCYQCHKDGDGAGGMFSYRSKTALSQKATGFHN